jgi:hypothetical protein
MRSLLDGVRWEHAGRRVILSLQRRGTAEQRTGTRRTAHKPLRVVPIRPDGSADWDAAYEAISRNFSENGLALLQQHLQTTDRVLIGIPGGPQPTYVPVEIRHCRRLEGQLVELGCRFLEPARLPGSPSADQRLEDVHDAIGSLLAEARLAPSEGDERRAHARVAYTERIEIVAPCGTPVAGYARNLSRGGIAFIATVPMPLEPCLIRLPQSAGPPLGVQAQILRCTRVQDGFFDVGARFLSMEKTASPKAADG